VSAKQRAFDAHRLQKRRAENSVPGETAPVIRRAAVLAKPLLTVAVQQLRSASSIVRRFL